MNPTGTISNSDLELAALLLHCMVLEYIVPLKHVTAATFSDNKATVFWTKICRPKGPNPQHTYYKP